MGFGKDGKGVIIHERPIITLGALATIAAVHGGAHTLLEDFRIIKTEFTAVRRGGTAGQGPIVLFLADAELAVQETAQALNAGANNENDHLAMEQAHRPVFICGYFSGNGTTGFLGADQAPSPKEKTVRWTFNNPNGWLWGCFNADANDLTTGTEVQIHAKHFGVWVR